jgi:hypothetical protein
MAYHSPKSIVQMRISINAAERRLTKFCGLGIVVVSIAACAGKEATPADTSAGAGVGAAAGTNTPNSATTATQPGAPVVAAAGALSTYTLTEEHVTKVAQVMQTIQSLEKSDPALKAEWENHKQSSEPQTVDDAVARIASAPRAPEILKNAGISAHDYVYTTFALMYASVAYQMKKAGQPTNSPQLMSQLNPANIDFVATHQKAIQALSAINAANNANGKD